MGAPPNRMGGTGQYGKQIYIDQMFNLGGAAVTTLTSMNVGVMNSAGGYPPKVPGYLIDLIIQVSPQAATSLAQSGYVQLVCASWVPFNTLIIPFTGFGLATAPQVIGGVLETVSYNLALPVTPAQQITGSVIYFYSPVTPNITVAGRFAAT